MIVFALRGTQSNAWYSRGGAVPGLIGVGAPAPAVTPDAGSGIFGGSVLSVARASGTRNLVYNGRNNWSENISFSLLIRFVPRFSGNPTQYQYLFSGIAGDAINRNAPQVYLSPTGQLGFYFVNSQGALVFNYVSTNPLTFVSGTPIDVMFAWDGTTNANSFKVSVNGILVDQVTPGAVGLADNTLVQALMVGGVYGGQTCDVDINELLIWNDAQSVVYSPRTNFNPIASFDGLLPAINDVRQGVQFDAGTKTGLLDLPSVAAVKNGVTYDNGTKTGTLVSTDPGPVNVRKGTPYTIESQAKVGALDIPNPSIQKLLDRQPVSITIGESVEFLATIRNKKDKTVADLSRVTEITAKILKADTTILVLTMTGGDISVINNLDAGDVKINISKVSSALLAEADPATTGSLGAFEIITDDMDGNRVIYDYPTSLLVKKPLFP